MDVIELIKGCIKDCSELILKKIEESDTVIDDLILEKIKWFFRYLYKKF